MPHKDPEARRAYRREYYLSRQQESIEYARRRRAEDGDAINARRRQLHAEKPPEWHASYRNYLRCWRDAHPGYVRDASRKRREAHPEDVIYLQQWKQAHQEAVRAYAAQHRGRAAEGMTAQDKAESIEWRQLIANDPCFYCGSADAEVYEDDHYISVASGGTDHWWNLVRACQPCNRAKRTMNGDEFLLLAV